MVRNVYHSQIGSSGNNVDQGDVSFVNNYVETGHSRENVSVV